MEAIMASFKRIRLNKPARKKMAISSSKETRYLVLANLRHLGLNVDGNSESDDEDDFDYSANQQVPMAYIRIGLSKSCNILSCRINSLNYLEMVLRDDMVDQQRATELISLLPLLFDLIQSHSHLEIAEKASSCLDLLTCVATTKNMLSERHVLELIYTLKGARTSYMLRTLTQAVSNLSASRRFITVFLKPNVLRELSNLVICLLTNTHPGHSYNLTNNERDACNSTLNLMAVVVSDLCSDLATSNAYLDIKHLLALLLSPSNTQYVRECALTGYLNLLLSDSNCQEMVTDLIEQEGLWNNAMALFRSHSCSDNVSLIAFRILIKLATTMVRRGELKAVFGSSYLFFKERQGLFKLMQLQELIELELVENVFEYLRSKDVRVFEWLHVQIGYQYWSCNRVLTQCGMLQLLLDTLADRNLELVEKSLLIIYDLLCDPDKKMVKRLKDEMEAYDDLDQINRCWYSDNHAVCDASHRICNKFPEKVFMDLAYGKIDEVASAAPKESDDKFVFGVDSDDSGWYDF